MASKFIGDHSGDGSLLTNVNAQTLDSIDSTGFVKQLGISTTPDFQTPSSRRLDPNAANPTNEHYAVTTFGNGGNVTGQVATHFQTGEAYTRGYNTSWSGWRKQWDSANDGAGSGLDADLLDGLHASSFMRAQDANGYTGLVDSAGSNTNWIRTTVNGLIPYQSGGASALGTSSWPFTNIYANNIYDNGVLLETKFAAASHSHSNYLPLTGGTVNGELVFNQGTRSNGIYGTYSPTSIAHIWSMGTAYSIAADGSTGGNLYGMCYSYNPDYQTAGTNPGAVAGLNHQFQWRQNGVTQTAIGTGIYTVGDVTAYSDRRVKTNIEVIENALDKVHQINGYTFDRTDLDRDPITGEEFQKPRQAGVIAQEIEAVLPEAVRRAQVSDHLSVAYDRLPALLIEAVKEIDNKYKAEIDALKEQIEELRNGK